MSQQTAGQPNSSIMSQTDTLLRRAKEGVAAILALLIVICLSIMLWKAFALINRSENNVGFQQVKDLLLFINPLVGVVIGYYFNKVSTEARAENAEATAQNASITAQQATEARKDAENRAEDAEVESGKARDALRDVIPAAEALLARASALPVGVGAGGDAESLMDMRVELRKALQHARAIV